MSWRLVVAHGLLLAQRRAAGAVRAILPNQGSIAVAAGGLICRIFGWLQGAIVVIVMRGALCRMVSGGLVLSGDALLSLGQDIERRQAKGLAPWDGRQALER